MSFMSFLNFLWFILTGALVLHMVVRDPPLVSLQELKENLEDVYCRLPQSTRKEDASQCLSVQRLFHLLKNACTFELKKVKKITQLILPQKEDESSALPDGPKDLIESGFKKVLDVDEEEQKTSVEEKKMEQEKKKEHDITATVLDSCIVIILGCTIITSLVEWYKEWSRSPKPGLKGERTDSTLPGGEGSSGRRISLADLTVNRHIRRRESQQLEAIRQNSISSGSKPPPLLRRSSFPAQLPETRIRHAPQRQQSTPGMPMSSSRRLSVDLSEDDASPDRRRVRIIRRH